MNATREEIAKAFAEWEREYREQPETFMKDAQRFQTQTSDYGELCAITFEKFLAKIKS